MSSFSGAEWSHLADAATFASKRPSAALNASRAPIRRTIARHRLSNPRIFGSAARGEDVPGSDLDILVDRTDHTSLFDIAGCELELERLLGVPVQITVSTGLRQEFRDRISPELRPL